MSNDPLADKLLKEMSQIPISAEYLERDLSGWWLTVTGQAEPSVQPQPDIPSIAAVPAQHDSVSSVSIAAHSRPRGRQSVAIGVAFSILLAVGVGVFLAWRFNTDPVSPPAPLAFTATEQPTGLSGTSPPTPDPRSVILTIPALALEALGSGQQGRVCTLEFTTTELPSLWPRLDGACPWLVPNQPLPLEAQPFQKPLRGTKWVVLVVTDRPAAQTLTNLLAQGELFARESGAEAATAAVVAALQKAEFRVLAVGYHLLAPLPQQP